MPDQLTESHRAAWGVGLATRADDGTVLDVWYPSPALGPAPDDADDPDLRALEASDPDRGVQTSVVRTVSDLAVPPTDAADAYLRLHLLSHRLVRPHGAFAVAGTGVLRLEEREWAPGRFGFEQSRAMASLLAERGALDPREAAGWLRTLEEAQDGGVYAYSLDHYWVLAERV